MSSASSVRRATRLASQMSSRYCSAQGKELSLTPKQPGLQHVVRSKAHGASPYCTPHAAAAVNANAAMLAESTSHS